MSVVGIDLGTTNTVVACVRSGKVHVLADEHGVRLLPSVVSFHPNGEVLVGGAAKARRVIDPKNTVYSHKRLIGRSWGSPEIAQAKSRFAFELKEGPGQGPLVRARGQDYTLPEISAFVLKRARQISETALGTPVERAVITVPAHFNELQRASTKVAGRVSGLEVLRILNEPTAAALAYGLGRTGNERVAVYDFGGGTFDCTLLDLNGNVFEVLATAGDSFLGGDDVDNIIAERMADTYLKAHRYDPRTDAQMLERLKTSAEDIKMVLSTAETHTIVLKEFGHGQGGSSVNFTFTLTRRDLDAMITPLIERSFKVTQDALALARLSPTSFDKIILVGGSTRIPLVRKRVEAFFGQAPLDRVNPDEVVSIGAAIQAAALTEGARRRSIPAAPPVIGKPKTLQGLQKDLNDDTQTGTFDADKPQAPAPGPAFGSSPPGFGFHPASSPPPASTKSGPPPPSSPGAGVSGARQPAQPGRKITNPGVAPATQPLGARSPSAPPPAAAGPSQAGADDPSMASFPDLAVPTPFEWFPSGHPSSGGAAPAGSERSFGGNTIDTRGTDPGTMTQAGAPQPGAPNAAFMTGPPRPARMGPDDSAGFGAIDEPPSMYSTPSASVPSFPSMTGPAGDDAMPSPIGEPEPFRASDPSIPGGQFGAVRDLSLVSTSAVTSGVPATRANPSEPAFGHLPDLSLVSSSSATAEIDDVTEARQRMSEALEDETEAFKKNPLAETQIPATVASATTGKGSTMSLEPAANPAARTADPDDADLPAVVATADLPAVVNRGGKRPEIRRGGREAPKEPGMSASGAPNMLGKPPPALAPQPFGPMERIGGDDSPPSRTASLQGRPQIQPKQGGPAPKTQAQPQAKQPTGPGKPKTQPLATTAPLGQTSPANASGGFPAANVSGAHPAQPGAPTQQSPARGNKTAAFGSTQAAPPPIPQQPPPAQNPAFNSTPALSPHGVPSPQISDVGAYGSSPPPVQQYYGSQPPNPFAQAAHPPPIPPPAAIQHTAPMPAQTPAQAPPPMQHQGASQPPLFGAYPSNPPAGDPGLVHGSAFEGNTASMPPQVSPTQAPIQSIGYASPVLVDVTPRGLVVETAGGYTDTIIPRNSKIPCERTRRFATGRDMQTTVRVRVAQGEHQFFPQNTYLGEVELSGLRPAPRGEVVVAVTFEVDADGTLRVRARDVQTGQEARAVLQLIGVADESSVVMMINRFAQQPVVGGPTQ